MEELKIVTVDNLHQSIISFWKDNEIVISEYEDMKYMILKMISGGYCFSIDRDRLRDAMEDITYMILPDDEVSKDRVAKGLEYEEDSDSEEEDPNEMINLMKAMGMNMPGLQVPQTETETESEEQP